MSLLTIGTVAFDRIETPFDKTDKIVGGSAAYAALSAAAFTNTGKVVAVVGDDFPAEELARFEAKGIDIEGVQVKEGQPSFFWAGRYHNDMNTRDTLVTELNVLADFDPLIPQTYQGVDYLMLGNFTPSLQRLAIERLDKRPAFIVMDTMNYWIENDRAELEKTIKLVDLLSINDEEARQFSGEYSLVKAAQKILRMGPTYLVIKKGEHGALLFERDNMFYVPALPLETVFDPTGAGDTFAGGMMGYLTQTRDTSFENLKRAVVYGSAMASFCVEQFGTEALHQLDRGALEDRVNAFVCLVKFDIALPVQG